MDKICVLMCVYNGEKFLGEQLDSIKNQTGVQAQLLIHDDGSKDTSKEVVNEFIQENQGFASFDFDYLKARPECNFNNLPRTSKEVEEDAGTNLNGQKCDSVPAMEHLGAARGFWHLLKIAPEADYYAFCDQDDVWDSDKLQVAIQKIKLVEHEISKFGKIQFDVNQCNKNRFAQNQFDVNQSDKNQSDENQDTDDKSNNCDASVPVAYCCSQRLTDSDGNVFTEHRLSSQRTINSRLFYASIPGNTIVFNKALLEKAREHDLGNCIMHDSWLIKLCIALGGKLIVDEEPHMNYRMHGKNEVGMELNFRQKLLKFKRVQEDLIEYRELEEIVKLYGDEVADEIKTLATASFKARKEKSYRKEFLKNCDVDFKSKGFNLAFKKKVMSGRI